MRDCMHLEKVQGVLASMEDRSRHIQLDCRFEQRLAVRTMEFMRMECLEESKS